MRAVVLVGLACVGLAQGARDPPMPVLTLDPDTLSVSGISSGGAMAVQFGTAFSSLVKGVGVVAGVPFQCAQGLAPLALTCMSDPSTINVSALMFFAQNLEKLGKIDPLKNVADQTITLFSGQLDSIVKQGTMVKVQKMYEELSATDIEFYGNYSAEHSWVTENYGNPCPMLAAPFINKCGIDFPGIQLRRAFLAMGLDWNDQRGTMDPARLITFDQSRYGASANTNSLDATGYLYVPLACASNSTMCHLHVAFHGCGQYAKLIGQAFVLNSGLNEWAEANNVVILYPQTVKNDLLGNPQGCYDWWGYCGGTLLDFWYATRDGKQMKVIRDMIRAVGGF